MSYASPAHQHGEGKGGKLGSPDLLLRQPGRLERLVHALDLAVDAARHVGRQAGGEVRLAREGPDGLRGCQSCLEGSVRISSGRGGAVCERGDGSSLEGGSDVPRARGRWHGRWSGGGSSCSAASLSPECGVRLRTGGVSSNRRVLCYRASCRRFRTELKVEGIVCMHAFLRPGIRHPWRQHRAPFHASHTRLQRRSHSLPKRRSLPC